MLIIYKGSENVHIKKSFLLFPPKCSTAKSRSTTSFEDSEWIRYSEIFIARILLNTYIISGSQNLKMLDGARQGCSNPPRIDNTSGSTNTLHPSSLTGIASLPPRPATVARDCNPRNVAPNYCFQHSHPGPSLAATNEPLQSYRNKTIIEAVSCF